MKLCCRQHLEALTGINSISLRHVAVIAACNTHLQSERKISIADHHESRQSHMIKLVRINNPSSLLVAFLYS